MCGINGIISTREVNEIEKRIISMNRSIKHRGPDYTSYYIFNEKSALGHNRLKIIDLSEKSNQPMLDKNKKIGLVFNGEIYNFEEIKKELNYNFLSEGDTEVILAAYIEKGIDWFLNKANGMFAIGIYDYEKNKLILIRDRLGIKPLYYFFNKNEIIFSSEIKGILNSGLVEAIFNKSAIDLYLADRYVYEPYTFFKNIYQLEKSTYMVVDLEDEIKIHKKKYWNLPKLNFNSEYNENKLLEQLDTELKKAVKRRLLSDVPLGTYLSGGVDSSLLTAITALNKREKINTYTIGFDEKGFNEFEYAKIVSEKYNTTHHELKLGMNQYLESWLNLIHYKDGPISVPNEIPLAVMSSKLKEKITVVLSGEGADELFGGYGRIFRLPFYLDNNPEKDFYKELINNYEYVPRNFRDDFLIIDKSYRNEFDEKNEKMFSNLKNEEKMFMFFHERHIQGLLLRLDVTTMQTAVEGRVPFLDHELIEFVYSKIPYDLKLKWISEEKKEESKKLKPKEYSEVNDIPKYILRKLSYKYLPKEIIERKKMGFPVPLTNWFKEIIDKYEYLLKQSDWINQDKLDELIIKAKTEERSGQILWMFINIELFREKYFKKEWRW